MLDLFLRQTSHAAARYFHAHTRLVSEFRVWINHPSCVRQRAVLLPSLNGSDQVRQQNATVIYFPPICFAFRWKTVVCCRIDSGNPKNTREKKNFDTRMEQKKRKSFAHLWSRTPILSVCVCVFHPGRHPSSSPAHPLP